MSKRAGEKRLTKLELKVLQRTKDGLYPRYMFPAINSLLAKGYMQYTDDIPGEVENTPAGRAALKAEVER